MFIESIMFYEEYIFIAIYAIYKIVWSEMYSRHETKLIKGYKDSWERNK